MSKINPAIVSVLLVMALVVPCTIMTPAAANAVVIQVVLYNDQAGDGIDVKDLLGGPHRVEVSGIGQYSTFDSIVLADGQTVNYRLRRGGVVGPWQQRTFEAGDSLWELEFATVSVVLYNADDLLADPHQVEVSGVAQFVTGDTFHVPPGANISYRLRRGGVVGPWQQRTFEAGDYTWELEFATVEVVVYNADDLLADPHRVEVSDVGQFVTGDTFHVPPGANINYRLRRGGVVGPWQAIQFEAGDYAWELEFATVYVHLCISETQVEVSGVGIFADEDVMHVPPSANLSFRLRQDSDIGPWESAQFSAGDTSWDLGCVPCTDVDVDGVCDWDDNCVDTPNPGQEDGDGDGIGDACDNCPASPNQDQSDADHDGIGDACDATFDVTVDIKPGSDVNPLNVHSRGKLPIAILGSDSFDVMMVDPPTVLLSWDGLTPLNGADGVAPLRWSWEDVNDDGFTDIVLKYSMNTLGHFTVTREEHGEEIIMRLTGLLSNGIQIVGEDTVLIINNKNR